MSTPVQMEVERGQRLLLGREVSSPDDVLEPEPSSLSGEARLLASPVVSRRHLQIDRDSSDVITLRDLGSTNGTWVRLHEGLAVRVEAAASLRLRIEPDQGHVRGADPPAPLWKNEDDYPEALRDVLDGWAAAQRLPVRFLVVGPGEGMQAGIGRVSLPRGGSLLVDVPNLTVAGPWSDFLARTHAFVSEQNALFERRIQEESAGLIVASPAMQSAWRQVVAAAARGVRVILLGPSGSGKSRLAESYGKAAGSKASFVACNCSHFGDNTEWIRSQLFGAAPGAYSGAPRRGVQGLVRRADGGTLFLDEVGDLTLLSQEALLTFLDNGRYTPIGSPDSEVATVKIVSATNKDLRAMTRDGRFREDLWYRLSGMVIEVPPLNERREDLRAFIERSPNAIALRLTDRLSSDAWTILDEYPWPGGFREVQNLLGRISLEDATGVIDGDLCRRLLSQGAIDGAVRLARSDRAQPASAKLQRATVRWREVVEQALSAFDASACTQGERYADFESFIEKFLKPSFVGSAAGVGPGAEIPRDLRINKLAERLGCTENTVRAQLKRYEAIPR